MGSQRSQITEWRNGLQKKANEKSETETISILHPKEEEAKKEENRIFQANLDEINNAVAKKKEKIRDTIFNYYNGDGKITTASELKYYCSQLNEPGRRVQRVTTKVNNINVTRSVCTGRPEYESCLLGDWMGFTPDVAEKEEAEKNMISEIQKLDSNYKTHLKHDLPGATAYFHRKSEDGHTKMHLVGVYLPPLSGGRKTKARRKHRRKTKNVKK
jgi:hypothetical protein